MKSFLNPAPFQGKFKRKFYFEGWYLKHVSSDKSRVLSFIPGVSLSREGNHCFIQVIDGISGQTWYCSYPLESFEADRKHFSIRLGDSLFSQEGCRIRIDEKDLQVSGDLQYEQSLSFPRSFSNPGIMGWFSYIPGMECRHDVLSMNHFIKGELLFNQQKIDFTEGLGYIEKDWGWNFPSSYIWLQCNNFDEPDTSFMLAVALIPLGPICFTGFLGFFHNRGQTRVFGTWNRWRISSLDFQGIGKGSFTLTDGKESLSCRVEGKEGGSLKAPAKGAMSQVIKESVNSDIVIDFKNSEGGLRTISGSPAGFEERGVLNKR
ncbi:tocopherol cyclase family protein [Oceanispirochaeta sp.]|uniref:tocopherol cyclase family protein n=1 Tax=Oceanispirochaeta sp. TaxID=2035350 RepID=UPI002608996A|nr:tocopherol cyclase family protein [Oceanispirochaeta sp.]MDA3956106.1 tocopherol cyclase family protein [Oceanispirochaeta sp.]